MTDSGALHNVAASPSFSRAAAAVAVAFAVALPWLNPFAGGPSAAVQPLLFGWFCCGVLAWFAAPTRRRAWLLLLAACTLAVLTTGVAVGREASALREWLPLLGAALAVAVCAGIARQPRLRRAVLFGLLAAASLSAAIGLLQYFGLAADFFPWLNVAPAGEAFGNLRQRNQLASLLNIGIVALLWLADRAIEPAALPIMAAGSRAPALADTSASTSALAPHPMLRAWAAPAAVLLALGNAATASRTGFVQLLLVAALAAWWQWRWRRAQQGAQARWAGGWQVLLPALLAYALGALLLPTLAGLDPNLHGPFARLAHGAQPCASRLVLWRNVLELIALKPWTGWGLGELDYAHFIHLYDGPRFCDILDNAHNLPLQLAVEFGAPAALLLCGALLLLMLRAAPWRERDATRQFAWSVLALIGLHSLLEYPLWYAPFQMCSGLALGLLLAPARPQISAPGGPYGQSLAAISAIFIVASCLFVAHDYSRISQIYLPPAQRSDELRANPIAALAEAPTLFADQVRFARLTTAPVTHANVAPMYALASRMLHFSPEPRVVERLIDSARLLGLDDEVAFYQARLAAAFPAVAAAARAGSQPGASASAR